MQPVVLLLWSAAGTWLVGPGDAARQLAASASPITNPVAAQGGAWVVADGQRLQHWRHGTAGPWAPAAEHVFGETVHAIGASADGDFVLAAHGERLSLLDGSATLVRRYEGRSLDGRLRGRAAAIASHAGRRSMLVSWPALGELWEISLDPAAPPIFDGLVHDYRMGEAIATPGYLGARRAPLGTPMPELEFVDPRVPWVAGRLGEKTQVVHLDVRRRIAEWTLAGARPAASLVRRAGDGWNWWLPTDDALHVIDTSRWTRLEPRRLPQDTDGPVRVGTLQALGEALWLLAGEAPARSPVTARAGIWVRRATAWQRVDTGAGQPVAMQADAAGRRIALATADPARVLVLDASAAVQHAWPLPSSVGVPLGIHWLSPGT